MSFLSRYKAEVMSTYIEYADFIENKPTNEKETETVTLEIQDSRIKEETNNYRLKSSLLLSFEDCLVITEASTDEGAILLEVMSADDVLTEMWLPKKVCSNLDLEDKTICVWDKVLNKKIEDMGGLCLEPEYANT